MKRTTLILFLALISVPLFAAHILPGTAQKAAENFIKSKTDEKTSLRRIDYADQQHFQHLHVYGNNRCFVIVAGDDGVQPILAYSTENPFNTGKMPENLYEWLQGYEERIAEVAKNHEKASQEIQEEWERLLTERISPAKDGPSQAVARTTDYTSRFKLVFSASAKIANEENFAFVSDGQLVFTDRGTLQVMDLLGHVLHTQTITPFTSHLSVLTFPTGVYVLRLINDHETKTQKIIIE